MARKKLYLTYSAVNFFRGRSRAFIVSWTQPHAHTKPSRVSINFIPVSYHTATSPSPSALASSPRPYTIIMPPKRKTTTTPALSGAAKRAADAKAAKTAAAKVQAEARPQGSLQAVSLLPAPYPVAGMVQVYKFLMNSRQLVARLLPSASAETRDAALMHLQRVLAPVFDSGVLDKSGAASVAVLRARDTR